MLQLKSLTFQKRNLIMAVLKSVDRFNIIRVMISWSCWKKRKKKEEEGQQRFFGRKKGGI